MNYKACWTLLVAICLMGLAACTAGDRTALAGSSTEAIAAAGGTPQSHAISGAFASPLVVAVTNNGAPVGGVTVTFTAPTTGASGTFADTGTNTTTATTNASGFATSTVFIANGVVGAYTVTASAPSAQSGVTFNLSNTSAAPAAVIATSGTPQSTNPLSPFPSPLVATVVDAGQNPVQNAVVTFQAPATGASGIFPSAAGNTTATAITNASGVASLPFFANASSGSYIVTATVAGVTAPANFNLTNLGGAAATITATSGTPQSTLISTAFPLPLVATVTDSNSNPVSGVAVTFTAPTTPASGTFVNGATETDTTDANGRATSSAFTANATAGGPYIVTATAAGVTTPASFSLTNTSTVVTSKTYVFYLSGEESPSTFPYGLAGAVQIDSTGRVIAGEQDYNDGSGVPSNDTITGGTLSVSSTTGQGTLTLVTNNLNRGVQGTETLRVQFVNASHALIIQFDGTATSSGSMDVQTLPATLSGGYAFSLAGMDASSPQGPVGFGGVFTISGTTLTGNFDTNDNGIPALNASLSGTLTPVDLYGRGTISTNSIYSSGGTPVVFSYYVVGPEVLRIIDVDTTDSAIGSAFGQGVNATAATNASLQSSVFGIAGDLPFVSIAYATAGMFSTNASAGTFSGIGDDNEIYNQNYAPEATISGTYNIASNGYGSLTFTGGFGNINTLGIYLTDPNLNLSDPNNTTPGLGGGAIAVDMDGNVQVCGGIGVLIPQTAPSSSSFAGTYAFGAQGFNVSPPNPTGEFDFAGVGSVTNLSLSGTGFLADPFLIFGAQPTNTPVQFSGTAVPDTINPNPGRYTMSPLQLTLGINPALNVVVYQANGGQLLWLDTDSTTEFLGSLQQQGSLAGIPGTNVLTETITATSGTGQSAPINTAFAAPLVATVTTGGSPTSGVAVTFTVTASGAGAGGTFTGSSSTATVTTNASGVATSPTFTANGIAGSYTVTAAAAGVPTPVSFSLTNTAVAVETITATSGTPQSAVVSTAFAAPLVATVMTGSSPTSGVVVTFSAPPTTGASGTFAGGINTATTNALGVATSPVFTANATAGSYAVTAAAPGVLTSASFSLTNTAAAVETITATSGTPQSATVSTAFAAPLVATVMNGSSPASGVLVTFTPPTTGASGTFAGGINTATTDALGVATSPVFTANATAGTYAVTAAAPGVLTSASFGLTNTAVAVETITATSGTAQSATVSTAFALPLVATVTTGGTGTSGVVVTFTAPASGASGTFTGGSRTATATTNASGIATSPTFTANGTAGGPYTVAATVAGVATPADFSLTNTPAVVTSKTYVFYLSGEELSTFSYGLAGAVQIDSTGKVITGEQDYNDGAGVVSSDTITDGTLSVDPTTGQGTLTLVRVQGTEKLGVQFVNANHALIIQFDGTATSSGSLDLQTLPATLSGGYAFTLAGLDPTQLPVALGGLFTISGTTLTGSLDTNDNGAVALNASLSGTLTTVDALGRGTITTNSIYSTPVSLNYYVVGPKVLRIIDVDTSTNDSAIGSAFGQGVNASGATNASLGSSVFGIMGDAVNPSTFPEFGVVGMFSTNPSAGTFSGVADDNELFLQGEFPASSISGSYTIASNGYGSLTIPSGSLGSISALGVYMTDPTLNLLDPNNTSGLGGALLADMDANSGLAGGIGLVLPQTAPSSSSFTGPYAFGGQDFYINGTAEFDFVGLGTVTGTAPNLSFSGTGLVSDPFLTLGAQPTNPGVPFSGNPVPDGSNPGRYTMSPLQLTVGVNPALNVVIYQASGGQLLWLNNDPGSVFLGTLQQQGSLTGLPAARRALAKASVKRYK